MALNDLLASQELAERKVFAKVIAVLSWIAPDWRSALVGDQQLLPWDHLQRPSQLDARIRFRFRRTLF